MQFPSQTKQQHNSVAQNQVNKSPEYVMQMRDATARVIINTNSSK